MNDWSNTDNAFFYDNDNGADILNYWSTLGGLASCPDLKAITEYITPAKNILEIGAGFGRVVNHLLAHYKDKQITAIERSKALARSIDPRCEIIISDVLTLKTEKRYSLILWLWSGITDFSKDEQETVLKKVAGFLATDGVLIVETFPHDITPANGSMEQAQSYKLSAEGMELNGYIPSPVQMNTYAKHLNLPTPKKRTYVTDSGRERILYIFK